jgi:hypothetical protein
MVSEDEFNGFIAMNETAAANAGRWAMAYGISALVFAICLSVEGTLLSATAVFLYDRIKRLYLDKVELWKMLKLLN